MLYKLVYDQTTNKDANVSIDKSLVDVLTNPDDDALIASPSNPLFAINYANLHPYWIPKINDKAEKRFFQIDIPNKKLLVIRRELEWSRDDSSILDLHKRYLWDATVKEAVKRFVEQGFVITRTLFLEDYVQAMKHGKFEQKKYQQELLKNYKGVIHEFYIPAKETTVNDLFKENVKQDVLQPAS